MDIDGGLVIRYWSPDFGFFPCLMVNLEAKGHYWLFSLAAFLGPPPNLLLKVSLNPAAVVDFYYVRSMFKCQNVVFILQTSLVAPLPFCV